MNLRNILARGLKLRCPICGKDKLFRGWFKMNDDCLSCGLHYEREPGYFLGSIYINYGVTALIAMVSYFSLWLLADMAPKTVLWIVTAFCVIFPLLFYRWARSMWLAMDRYFDPPPKQNQDEDSSDL